MLIELFQKTNYLLLLKSGWNYFNWSENESSASYFLMISFFLSLH